MHASLFILPFPPNTGYAIAPLESLFFEAGLDIANGAIANVHFAYSGNGKERPSVLPNNFTNLVQFNVGDTSQKNIRYLADYVKRHNIRLVFFLDIQPVHPLFKALRQAGATALVSYWGAPMSSRMPTWKLMLKRLEVSLSRSRLDGLIFESHAMADLAIYGRGVSREMIDIVPLGIDTELFKPAVSDYAYEALKLPRERRIVVYSGHMESRKGVRTLIEAAINLLTRRGRQDVCFLLCGNRPGESDEYESLYAGLGIDGLIRFGGYRSDLPRIYPTCFCGVIPSSGWDSFPRTSLELAAAGLPVVASRLGGLPEAVLDRETGLLFEPGNAIELVECLQTLLDQPESARKYGQRGRERCESELNLDVQRKRLRAAIHRHLKN